MNYYDITHIYIGKSIPKCNVWNKRICPTSGVELEATFELHHETTQHSDDVEIKLKLTLVSQTRRRSIANFANRSRKRLREHFRMCCTWIKNMM